MRKKAFVATVQILVPAESAEEVCDDISEMLDGVRTFVLDWAYLKLAGQRLYPTEHPVNIVNYTRGDFLL